MKIPQKYSCKGNLLEKNPGSGSTEKNIFLHAEEVTDNVYDTNSQQ